jgi:DNA-binding SARP family transcriptional activator
MHCFGGFALCLGGIDIDCTTVKPRARAALHLLAVNRGRPVHRESLLAALWPDTDARSATRNLQVVVSSLRQLLEPGVARGASSLMVREGDAYRLALPDDADVDLWAFEAALAEGRASRSAAAFERALSVYAGDLLPEDGPAEWVVEERERYRLEAAGAAVALAELRLAAGEPAEAAAVCERGLRIDRYNDELWRMLVEAYGQADNQAAATRARKGYEDMLADLGLT